MENLAACRQHGSLFDFIRQKLQQRFITAQLAHTLHLFLFDNQRDNARTAELIALLHRRIAVTRRNHHLSEAVHQAQTHAVNLEQTVGSGCQLNLALFHRRFIHHAIFADVAQNACGIIFMQHAFVGFPHI